MILYHSCQTFGHLVYPSPVAAQIYPALDQDRSLVALIAGPRSAGGVSEASYSRGPGQTGQVLIVDVDATDATCDEGGAAAAVAAQVGASAAWKAPRRRTERDRCPRFVR